MGRLFSFFLAISISPFHATAQPVTDAFLADLLSSAHRRELDTVLQHADSFRCQVIYTQINRDRKNRPRFTSYSFNVDPELYFNPASMVKLPLAALALEKLNVLRDKGIDRNTIIQFDSSYPGQRSLYSDTTAYKGQPTLAHFIRRALLISENDPYNRFYQFVGQGPANRILHEKGYTDTRITRQFMGLSQEQNRHTNAVRFIGQDGRLIYAQPAAYNTDSFDFRRVIRLGRAYLNRDDSLIPQPFDFTAHNNVPLRDLQQILQSLVFPSSVPERQRFRLTEDDRRFLLTYLSQYPSETSYPLYDTSLFYDSYVKFFFRDSTRKMPPGVRVFNKVGWAYGFLTDVSYVADFNNGIEYMLSATLYVNSDGILNDNRYDYLTIGHPFLYQLGQAIYQYERNRKRKRRPDLSGLIMPYEKRDPADRRQPIRDVDN